MRSEIRSKSQLRLPAKAVLCLLLGASSAFGQTFTAENPAGKTAPGVGLSAYEVFYSMYDQTIDLVSREVKVEKSTNPVPVTFGAEKEGSSSKIVRVMSPAVDKLLVQKLRAYPEFGLDMMRSFANGGARSTEDVYDVDGKLHPLNQAELKELQSTDWRQYTIENNRINNQVGYQKLIDTFIKIFPPESEEEVASLFSYFKMDARKHFFEAKTSTGNRILGDYDSWVPLAGEAEKYIDNGHREINKGWEVLFKPQNTYADFELQIQWFRKIMGSRTKLFEGPGHNRIVMPRATLSKAKAAAYRAKAGELSRMVQAYVVLRGLKAKTGLLGARHKTIVPEKELKALDSDRGPVRLEIDRFYEDSIGIEFRVGMKDEAVRRFLHAVYTSRLATGDMDDLATISSYKLETFDNEDEGALVRRMVSSYGVDKQTAQDALENWTGTEKAVGQDLEIEFLLPLWHWDRAPFAKAKKENLNRLTKDFIIRLSRIKDHSYADISELISQWVTSSNLIADIENYVTPKKPVSRVASAMEVPIEPGKINVNQIALGNEFTARMPLKLKADYDDSHRWVQTVYDMTPEERDDTIRSVAESLAMTFTGSTASVEKLGQGSHGHSLVVAYSLKDASARPWRVEWDGVNRNYDTDGNIIEESARGGHVEIVSPKYTPSFGEVQAVYSAMSDGNLVPDHRYGGSHINVDYKLFENNPAALARFLKLFLKYRMTIAFMFQHVNRLRSAEPVTVSRELDRQLQNFNGTKEDLAALLYNERFFNTRVNRKTRYSQIDLSNFMGNVIPKELIKPDFDVVRANFTGGEGWSRQFRVTPYTKIELRLFDAAMDELEAASQIKIVRALLNRALNDNDQIQGSAQKVDYRVYVNNPALAYSDLQTMVSDLRLDYLDYSMYMTSKLVENGKILKSPRYQTWLERADSVSPKATGWGKAVISSVPGNRQAGPPSIGSSMQCHALFAY